MPWDLFDPTEPGLDDLTRQSRTILRNIQDAMNRGDQFFIAGTDERLEGLIQIFTAISDPAVQVECITAFPEECPPDWQRGEF